jgi:phosphoserine aminotransferase
LHGNVSGKGTKAQYVDGGFWSNRAFKEGMKYCQASKIAQTYVCPSNGKLRYPDISQWCAFVSVRASHRACNVTLTNHESCPSKKLVDAMTTWDV